MKARRSRRYDPAERRKPRPALTLDGALGTPRDLTMVATRLDGLAPVLMAATLIALLYFGRSVLIPIVLAILLSFLLSPIIAVLRRLRFGRGFSVLLTVMFALGAIGATGTVIGSQAATLMQDAPAYAQRIAEKSARVEARVRTRFAFLFQNTAGGSGHRGAAQARHRGLQSIARAAPATAIPVEVQPPPPSAIDEIRDVALPILAPLEIVLIVLIVTVFILFQKEDLRDRLIRLMGARDLHRTTLALDDGAQRLSRYFLSQFAINSAFGGIIWAGLFFLGIPAPGLWGILAALLRFVPYVGSLAAAVAPIALAAAIGQGWTLAISVTLLFVIVEPLIGYGIEPLLYGRSTGLSPISVVIAALFWTWVWGPVGLVLSMPMTLMLVVLGRHIPALEFFDVLLGDRPPLTPPETFYQRMLSGQVNDAVYQAEDLLLAMPVERYFDEVALAGLRLAALDVDRGAVERSSLAAVSDTSLEVVNALADFEEVVAPDADASQVPSLSCAAEIVLCIPGRGPLDRAVSAMVVQCLDRRGTQARVRERLGSIDAKGFDPGDATAIAIIGLFDDRAYRRVALFADQLRTAFPQIRIFAGVERREADGAEAAQRAEAQTRPLATSIDELCDAICANKAGNAGGAVTGSRMSDG